MSKGHNTVRLSGGPPWGFRLVEGQTGVTVLKIAKVRPKSKAFNILREGDVLLRINGIPSDEVNYDQAMDILDSDIVDLTLEISRGDEIGSKNEISIDKQSDEQLSAVQTAGTLEGSPSEAMGTVNPPEAMGTVNPAEDHQENQLVEKIMETEVDVKVLEPELIDNPTEEDRPELGAVDANGTSIDIQNNEQHILLENSLEPNELIGTRENTQDSDNPLKSGPISVMDNHIDVQDHKSNNLPNTYIESDPRTVIGIQADGQDLSNSIPELQSDVITADINNLKPISFPEILPELEPIAVLDTSGHIEHLEPELANHLTQETMQPFGRVNNKEDTTQTHTVTGNSIGPEEPAASAKFQIQDHLENLNTKHDVHKQAEGWNQQEILETINNGYVKEYGIEEYFPPEKDFAENDISAFPNFNEQPQQKYQFKRVEFKSNLGNTKTTGNTSASPYYPQQQIPVRNSGPAFGLSPNDDLVNVGSNFQSPKFVLEIEQQAARENQVAPNRKFQQIHQGGDGDLSASIKDFSDHPSNFSQELESNMGSTGTMFKVRRISSMTKCDTWTPSVSFATNDTTASYRKSTDLSNKANVQPYSTPEKPRPVSMPPVDFHFDSSPTKSTPMDIQTNGRASSEEKKFPSKNTNTQHDYHRLLKVMQPPPDSEHMDFLLSGKKMFSSSSFYEEPGHKYPTVEEQVELCRKIANSLSADTNKLSRGASMYSKRRKRADKWVFEGPDPEDEPFNQERNYSSSPDSSKYRNGSCGTEDTSGRRKLKLVLDPRQLQDATKLRNSGLYNEHNVVSPDICFDLVKDLNSPTGKGAALFAKRKKKSEKWIVDETTVKQHEHHTTTTTTTETTSMESKFNMDNRPISQLDKLIHQQRLKLVKSPWEAALESPIGSCDAAFLEMRPGGRADYFAETIMKRAEEYIPPPPPIIVPPLPQPSTTATHLRPLTPTGSWTTSSPLSADAYPGSLGRSATPTYSRYSVNPEIYKPRAPRGWGGYSTDYLSTDNFTQESQERLAPSPQQSSWNLGQFTDFNCRPKLWGETGGSGFRPVRPPSLLLTK